MRPIGVPHSRGTKLIVYFHLRQRYEVIFKIPYMNTTLLFRQVCGCPLHPHKHRRDKQSEGDATLRKINRRKSAQYPDTTTDRYPGKRRKCRMLQRSQRKGNQRHTSSDEVSWLPFVRYRSRSIINYSRIKYSCIDIHVCLNRSVLVYFLIFSQFFTNQYDFVMHLSYFSQVRVST